MKKLKLLILILLITPVFVFAQELTNEQVTTPQTGEVTDNSKVDVKDRNNESNLGVNKKWTITDRNRDNVLRTPYVNAEDKIYDFSGIITDEEKKELKTLIDNFYKNHKMELIIVTYNLPYTYDDENEDFAADFYDYNDFGLDFDHYDGVLLFRNTYPADRYYDMYTFGEAQLYFDQSRYDYILDSIYGDLSNNRYQQGFTNFINMTSSYIDQGKPSSMSNKYIDEMGYIRANYVPPFGIAGLISILVTAIVIGIMISKNKMVRKATEATAYMNKASLNYTKKQDNFISTHTTSYTISHDSGGGGGGGFSSGGSSGGGHSSGGGRHG